MKIQKPLTPDNIEELADRIYKLFRKNNMWSDCRIYFNGNALDTNDGSANGAGSLHYDGMAFLHEGMDPNEYFEYVNPEHILSMSFEGPIYHMFNYNEYRSVMTQFRKLLDRFGVYYELGNAWNLTLYYI